MSVAELLLALAFAGLLVAGGLVMERRHQEAVLGQDLVRVRDVAQRYAASRCANPPPAAVTLDDARSELGLAAPPVRRPERWRIAMTARPGRMGSVTAVHYDAPAQAWQAAYLMERPGATRTAAGVTLALDRPRQPAAARGSFQLLLENQLC